MSPSKRRGLLIAIEGIDGAGKTTQARLLRETLEKQGYEVALFREPGDSRYGREIRELSKHGRTISAEEEMVLFREDRRIDVADNIEPALSKGAVVVMDRYYFSSMAYQGAAGLDPQYVQAQNEEFAPRPDLTLVLDVTPRVGIERIHARQDTPNSFEVAEDLEEARKFFHTFESPDVVVVDGLPAIDAVQAQIWALVKPLLQRVRRGKRRNIKASPEPQRATA